MNPNFFSTTFTVSLFLITLLFLKPIDCFAQQTVAQNTQMTIFNLPREGLNFPFLLLILPSPSIKNLQGQVLLNGKVIEQLNLTGTKLNLSSQLKVGRNQLIITGKYAPVDATVRIHLEGLNTQVDQQTEGNGTLNQTLILEVY